MDERRNAAARYLKMIRRLDNRIDDKIRELGVLRARAEGVQAVQLHERVQTSRSSDGFCNMVIRIIEQEQKINAAIDELTELKAAVKTAVDNLDSGDEQMVLRLRFFEGMKWEEIAAEMNASVSTVRRWYYDALEKIELPEDGKHEQF